MIVSLGDVGQRIPSARSREGMAVGAGVDGDAGRGSARVERVARAVAVGVGVVFVVVGVWAFVAPRSFFDAAAVFEPYNRHFLRDIGAFQIGLGAVLVLAGFLRDALVVALAGVGVGAAFHAASHVVDRRAGGDPAVDIPLFAVVALLLLGAAVARAVTGRSR